MVVVMAVVLFCGWRVGLMGQERENRQQQRDVFIHHASLSSSATYMHRSFSVSSGRRRRTGVTESRFFMCRQEIKRGREWERGRQDMAWSGKAGASSPTIISTQVHAKEKGRKADARASNVTLGLEHRFSPIRGGFLLSGITF